MNGGIRLTCRRFKKRFDLNVENDTRFSFVMERSDRIDARGAPRRDGIGNESHDEKKQT